MKSQVNPKFIELEANLKTKGLPLDLPLELEYFQAAMVAFAFSHVRDLKHLYFNDLVQYARITYYQSRIKQHSPNQSIARAYYRVRNYYRDNCQDINGPKTITPHTRQVRYTAPTGARYNITIDEPQESFTVNVKSIYEDISETTNRIKLFQLLGKLKQQDVNIILMLSQGLKRNTIAKILEVDPGTITNARKRAREIYQTG